MVERIAADVLVVLHLGFIVFVCVGGLCCLKWPRVAFLHLPAAIWGALIEFGGGICPLTPLEQSLRRAAGESGYTGSFIDYYLVPVIYPDGLTRTAQIGLGIIVVCINLAVYAAVARRMVRLRRSGGNGTLGTP